MNAIMTASEEQGEQHDPGPRRPRHTMALDVRHERPGDGREDRAGVTGSMIVEVRPRSHTGPTEDGRPDQEPGQQAEVAEPHRRGEDTRE